MDINIRRDEGGHFVLSLPLFLEEEGMTGDSGEPTPLRNVYALGQLVEAYMTKHRSMRTGQAYFNVLEDYDPEAADEIRGTGLDPFYHNERIPKLAEWLERKWATDEKT